MNSTLHSFPLRRTKILSDEDFNTLDNAVACIMLIVSLVGVVTNSINIRAFVFMGLDDGISVSLMGLSVSDLGFTFFGSFLASADIINAIEVKYSLGNLPIQPKYVFGMFSVNIGFMFHLITCMITTFIAVARCMCVAMPFKFKDFFTKSRSIFALVMFNLIGAAWYMPMLSQMGVQRKFDTVVNKTRIVLWMSSIRSDMKDAVTFFHFVFFIMVSSFVVAICIVIMAKHLKQSVRFRQSSSLEAEGGEGKTEAKLSGKELRVVQQIIVICIIYVWSMIPAICFATARLVEKEFDVGRQFNNIYLIIGSVSIIYELANSATTFFVYYRYNSKFKAQCFSLRSTGATK